MTWWRRDPSLSPINRYAQRLLRSHESALRTRCFSRTPAQEAQHENNDGDKRPSGMSNLEWMQMQHYNRWQKRFTDDPYRALFGASHDMLNGKGLKDWEWISKTFPKWMLREMETEEDQGSRPKQANNTRNDSQYPKRVEIVNEQDVSPKRSESHFRQPSIRVTRLDRDDTAGIASPSDLRRPREQSYFKVVGQQPTTMPTSAEAAFAHLHPPTSERPEPSVPKAAEPSPSNTTQTKPSTEESAPVELSYLEQFLANQHQQPESNVRSQQRRSIWRQTALDRRSAQSPPTRPNKKAQYTENTNSVYAPQVSSLEPEKAEHLSAGSPTLSQVEEAVSAVERSPALNNESHKTQSDNTDAKHRSTSDVLKQLPKDDIDFLSAEDIRASMGNKRTRSPTDAEKKKSRQDLETTFRSSQEIEQNIHPMTHSKVINDQHIRRLERELQSPHEEAAGTIETERFRTVERPAVPEAPIEGTIDRLINLVSSHFWQTPAEPENLQKTRVFFEQFLTRVRRGRNAMKQIIEDLEKDVPASKGLLKLLQEHDDVLDSTVRKVQRRLDSGDRQATVSNQKTNERLRDRIRHTDNKLEAAFASVNETELPKNVLPSFKRRLQTASRVATKNLELTRQIAWGMQTHLEDPDIDRTILSGYQAVANTLLVVKHTQLALTLLLDRAMQMYGVSKLSGAAAISTSSQEIEASSSLESVMSEVQKTQLRTKIAGEERLAHEVDAQVAAMQGLSDNGYARPPKSAPRKPLEERSALAHSLFRPFGPVIESLGKDPSPEALQAEAEEQKRARDANLVAEVRKAYEDTYGAITVDHRQLADATQKVEGEAAEIVKSFAMLKEDDVSPDASLEQAPSNMTMPKAVPETPQVLAVETSSGQSQGASTVPISSNSPPEVKHDGMTASTDVPPASYPASMDLPTHYTILVHDPDTGKLSVTTSTTGPPRDVSPSVPLHRALATLSSPAKFVPFITEGLEVQSASPYVLVLRDALSDGSSTRPFETVNAGVVAEATETSRTAEPTTVNPIDGTARLSPTGYVGPEESQEQLEKEFEERRQAAERLSRAHRPGQREQASSKQEPKQKKRAAGGVVKTAIWAAAVCYVAGVIGEIAS